MLGTQTWARRIVGTDESTEPCRHPKESHLLPLNNCSLENSANRKSIFNFPQSKIETKEVAFLLRVKSSNAVIFTKNSHKFLLADFRFRNFSDEQKTKIEVEVTN